MVPSLRIHPFHVSLMGPSMGVVFHRFITLVPSLGFLRKECNILTVGGIHHNGRYFLVVVFGIVIGILLLWVIHHPWVVVAPSLVGTFSES